MVTIPSPFAASPVGIRRHDRLDALRGAAIVWMAVFHFCFDLNHFGLIREDFYTDRFWTWQRACIVSAFLFCAGLSQAVAAANGQSPARFWRRWAQVAGCALLVSLGSAWMFPRSFISFGVLHCIAVLMVVMRLAGGLGPWPLWLLGLAALALPQMVQHSVFDSRWTNWTGLVTMKPLAEDYVPLLPWAGVALWGLAAGRWALTRRPLLLAGALSPALRPLAALGRRSLGFYMLHQPLLIGLLGAVVWLRR